MLDCFVDAGDYIRTLCWIASRFRALTLAMTGCCTIDGVRNDGELVMTGIIFIFFLIVISGAICLFTWVYTAIHFEG